MTTLAFYMGRGLWADWVIRVATRSAFSHVELLAPPGGARRSVMTSISASPRDGGVRIKEITFHPARWVFVELQPWHLHAPFARARMELGAPYDWAAIAFSFALPLRRHMEGRFTCSELCAQVLGFPQPHLISPGDLYLRCLHLNRAFEKGAQRPLETTLSPPMGENHPAEDIGVAS